MRYAANEAIPIIEQLGGTLPSLLTGYRVKLLDGNCIEASEHRIEELRNLEAGALPGKSLVVLGPALHISIKESHLLEQLIMALPSAKISLVFEKKDITADFGQEGFIDRIRSQFIESKQHIELLESKILATRREEIKKLV